ncbi:MAG: hypothetical protein LC777_16180 [Actinobacteria bacterium]|nr:hypothetical protein [Actinomycetota bacterium]
MIWWNWFLVAARTTVAVDTAFIIWLLLAGRRQDARALVGFIPDCLVLFRRLLGDGRVPRRSKLLVAALIGYLAMPFDLMPTSSRSLANLTTRSSSRSCSEPFRAPTVRSSCASTDQDRAPR